jgi:hypothetical protein
MRCSLELDSDHGFKIMKIYNTIVQSCYHALKDSSKSNQHIKSNMVFAYVDTLRVLIVFKDTFKGDKMNIKD